MRKALVAVSLVLAMAAITAPAALAGSPHFIKSAFTVTRSDDTLTVSGKEAGLGDESQIHVVLNWTEELKRLVPAT